MLAHLQEVCGRLKGHAMQVHEGWEERHGDILQLGWRWQGQEPQSEPCQETLHWQE